jgi:hypothetical protein
MADNADKPQGLRFAYTTHGGPPKITKYKSTGTTAIYPGDYLILASGRVSTVTNDENGMGVALSYTSTTADQDVFVYDDLDNTVFTIQVDDGTLTGDTVIGAYYDIEETVGSTVTFQSRQELDGDDSAAVTLEVLGLVPKHGNAWGTNCELYVRVHVDTRIGVVT